MVGHVGRGMTSPSLNNTHSWTTSGVTCHHRLWEAHTVERRRAWHAIIALCDVPPSIQAERHPTRQPAGAAGAREQADHAGQQPRGPAAAEEAAVTTVSAGTAVTAVTAVTLVSGAAVSGVTSL